MISIRGQQGILELESSQKQNFVAIRGKLDDHEAHLHSLEQNSRRYPLQGSGGRGRFRQRYCFRCGQRGHIARNCMHDVKPSVDDKNQSSYRVKEGQGHVKEGQGHTLEGMP